MKTVAEEPVLQKLQGYQRDINRREREAELQKRCASCNHPYSFHGSGRTSATGCKAMGCKCAAWSEDDPWTSQEHYAAINALLRAMEVSSRLLAQGTQGERPVIYVGGYFEVPEVDLLNNIESAPVPGEWRPPFAVWANHGGAWGYSVVDDEGQVTDQGSEVMPHDTEAEEVARIIATWSFPPER